MVAAEAGQPAVEVAELTKRYPRRPVNAVDGISFHVAPGEVFGLLGPNGAGKTTTIQVLTTRLRATSGRVWVGGVDVAADPVGARRRLAVVPQQTNLDLALSVRQNLLFHASYFGVPAGERTRRADTLLEQFGLADRAGDKLERLSGGQAQRLMIARALMHEPEVLFCDEPTTGLDPQARLFVWDRIRELRDQGITVVLTTQNMDEAAELADRVAIVDRGRLLVLDAPAALTAGLPGRATLEVGVAGDGDGRGLAEVLAALDGVERAERVEVPAVGPPGLPGDGPPPEHPQEDGELRVRLYLSGEAAGMIGPVADVLTRRGASLTDVRIAEPSLEDVFIHLTGRGLR